MTKKGWVLNPNSGGVTIPKHFRDTIKERIENYAKEHYEGKYTRLEIRFKGQFCYIDADQEPQIMDGWPPEDWHETKEEYLERMRNTPTHLCRLRYFGDMEKWGFAFYTYSNEKYELSVFMSGDFYGTIEDAFEISANVYLMDI